MITQSLHIVCCVVAIKAKGGGGKNLDGDSHFYECRTVSFHVFQGNGGFDRIFRFFGSRLGHGQLQQDVAAVCAYDSMYTCGKLMLP